MVTVAYKRFKTVKLLSCQYAIAEHDSLTDCQLTNRWIIQYCSRQDSLLSQFTAWFPAFPHQAYSTPGESRRQFTFILWAASDVEPPRSRCLQEPPRRDAL